ncbi:hypothetical protein [Actinospica sp.]|jgi:hypothetical protein|uniref:hypothetical protein n=1 Tax=Actinospica sp. TaxID=1872142 RepID=UPI002B61A5DC|nr:hypothetical protein [Actinospica sp.]HWG24901.1 hypothetical protein [Actinospica sp.]
MDAVGWLLDGDPAIRWQAMRDITDASADEIEAERGRVAGEGWGARLLGLQLPSGQWTTQTPEFDSPRAAEWWHSLGAARQGTLFPQGTSTTTSLALLRDFGLPADDPAARRAVGLVRDRVQWEHDGEPYFDGETEPCINGRTVAIGAYFGEEVAPVVQRLLSEQMSDGGWNCEQENGSTRGSFHTTINVLEGLLEYERAVGRAPGGPDAPDSADVTAARLRGQEYLVERRLMRRLSTGQVIEQDRKTEAAATWDQFSYPTFWHYDVLRGLDYLRAAGAAPDERLAAAIELAEAKRGADGLWPLENPHDEGLHFAMDEGEGKPSRWNTLRALRVLKWYGR